MNSNESLIRIKQRHDQISNTIHENIQQQKEFFTTFVPTLEWPVVKNEKCRILILDSSFNPPTKAHLNLLEKAQKVYPPDFFTCTLFMFSTNNADKILTGASVVQRAEMMELLAYDKNAAVGFTKYGRFIDKAKAIQSWYPHSGDQLELHFILGYDTLIRLLDPKYYDGKTVKEVLTPFFEENNSYLVCADRQPFDEAVWTQIHQEYGDLIKRFQLDLDVATFSSTESRNAIQSNDNQKLDTVLSSTIINYILQQKNQIYN